MKAVKIHARKLENKLAFSSASQNSLRNQRNGKNWIIGNTFSVFHPCSIRGLIELKF
jgi:hypothetical protein